MATSQYRFTRSVSDGKAQPLLANLNDAIIALDYGTEPLADRRGKPVCDGNVGVFFEDLENRLADEIRRWPVVVGCMAWLTNRKVLAALASRSEVSIVVQKEDFLRPDPGGPFNAELRRLYAALPGGEGIEWSGNYSVCSGHDGASIRCAGIVKPRNETPPRMHHKFLVFCDGPPECEEEEGFAPRAVWTGSFNASQNATRSLENAVLITSKVVAGQYYREFIGILGLSEPLDWTHEYVDPEWRVGT